MATTLPLDPLGNDDLRDYVVVRVADEFVVDLMTRTCGIDYLEASTAVESITLVGEIVTNSNGACGWIESAENHDETPGENIRLVRKQRGLLHAPVSIFFVPMAHYCTYLQRSGLSP